jgi:hypothetical protein
LKKEYKTPYQLGKTRRTDTYGASHHNKYDVKRLPYTLQSTNNTGARVGMPEDGEK